MSRNPGTVFFAKISKKSYITLIFNVIYDLVGMMRYEFYFLHFNSCHAEPGYTLAFANSVDPDQLTSEETNWSGSALFAIKYVNL